MKLGIGGEDGAACGGGDCNWWSYGSELVAVIARWWVSSTCSIGVARGCRRGGAGSCSTLAGSGAGVVTAGCAMGIRTRERSDTKQVRLSNS